MKISNEIQSFQRIFSAQHGDRLQLTASTPLQHDTIWLHELASLILRVHPCAAGNAE